MQYHAPLRHHTPDTEGAPRPSDLAQPPTPHRPIGRGSRRSYRNRTVIPRNRRPSTTATCAEPISDPLQHHPLSRRPGKHDLHDPVVSELVGGQGHGPPSPCPRLMHAGINGDQASPQALGLRPLWSRSGKPVSNNHQPKAVMKFLQVHRRKRFLMPLHIGRAAPEDLSNRSFRGDNQSRLSFVTAATEMAVQDQCLTVGQKD